MIDHINGESGPIERTSTPHRRSLWGFLALLTALGAIILFTELGRMDVVTDNEGQRATPPIEMVRTGNYLIPTINGLDYLVKPPLLYWAIAGVYKATGVINEWTCRIPTAVCSILAVLALYVFTRRAAGERTARWAAILLLSSPYFIERSRWAEIDVPLTLFVLLSVLALRAACLQRDMYLNLAFAVLSGLALGAASMLKGPPAYLFVVTAWMGVQLAEGRDPGQALRTGLRWTLAAFVISLLFLIPPVRTYVPLPVALLVFALAWFVLALRYGRPTRWADLVTLAAVLVIGAALTFPWVHAVVNMKGLDYFSAMLRSEALERTARATDINSGGPWYYLVALPALLAPWGLLLPLHLSRSAWQSRGGFYRFAVVAGWLGVGLFSLIAGKEREYILPAVPLLLIATAYHLVHAADAYAERWAVLWSRAWRAAMPVFMPILVIGGAIYFTQAERHPVLIAECGVAAVLALAAAYWGFKRPSRRLQAVAACAMLAVCLGMVGRGFHYASTTNNTPRHVALACQRLLDAGLRVETVSRTNFSLAFPYPAVAFYLQREMPLAGNDAEKVKEQFRGKEPYYFLGRKDFMQELGALDRAGVYVIAGPHTSKKLMLVGNQPAPVSLEK